MHAIFMQSPFKFIIMKKALKSPLARLYSTRQDLKSSQKNYYDTLEITPHATQNEIKSAYYKLSLQYHPDKNKSDYAKQKFQDVSDAYEILSNHELRKNYDRHILVRQQPISSNVRSKSQFKDNVYPGATEMYNFDEWVKAHYGKQLYWSRMRRNAYEKHKMENWHNNRTEESHSVEAVLILLTMSLIVAFCSENFDTPVDKTEKNIEESKVID